MNTTEPHKWEVNNCSGNGLVPSDNKPLPEPVLTQNTRPQWVNVKSGHVIFPPILWPSNVVSLLTHHMTVPSCVTVSDTCYININKDQLHQQAHDGWQLIVGSLTPAAKEFKAFFSTLRHEPKWWHLIYDILKCHIMPYGITRPQWVNKPDFFRRHEYVPIFFHY